MAKANENEDAKTGQRAGDARVGDSGWRERTGEQQPEQAQPADGGGLRERTEQQQAQREEVRAAEDYAPPAGEGAKVNPDAQRSDPAGEAKPTA